MGRTLVFGDIHGCDTALDVLLERTAPTLRDRLIFLGDYVDRGPNSRGVIDRLLHLGDSLECVFLEGNHEEMMLDSIAGRSGGDMWLSFGGENTLRSYSPDVRTISMEDVPAEHIAFLEGLTEYHETAEHVFVHACVDPALPMSEQDRATLRWKKLYAADPHCSGRMVVCGHTSQASGLPLDFGHTLCIDTQVYGERGWLSCLDLDGMFVLQGNEAGTLRRLERDQFLRA